MEYNLLNYNVSLKILITNTKVYHKPFFLVELSPFKPSSQIISIKCKHVDRGEYYFTIASSLHRLMNIKI